MILMMRHSVCALHWDDCGPNEYTEYALYRTLCALAHYTRTDLRTLKVWQAFLVIVHIVLVVW